MLSRKSYNSSANELLISVILLVLLIPFSGQCVQAAEGFKASFKQRVTRSGELLVHFQIALQDNFVRSESEMPGGTTVWLQNSEGSFSLIPAEKVAYRVPEDDHGHADKHMSDYLGAYRQYLESVQAIQTGQETYEGYECDLFWFRDPASGDTVKVWLWREHDFPVRIETETPHGLMEIEFSDINLSPVFDEFYFSVPSDYQIADFPSGSPPPLPA